MGIFSSLGMKVAGGIGALLAILLGIQTLRLGASERRGEKWHNQLIVANAMIEQQNAAVDVLKADSTRREAEADRRLRDAIRANSADRELAKRVAEKRPLSGKCLTPPEVLGADL